MKYIGWFIIIAMIINVMVWAALPIRYWNKQKFWFSMYILILAWFMSAVIALS